MHSFFDSVLDVMDDVDIRYLFNFLFHPATVHVYRVLKKKEIKLYSWNVRKDNASRQKYSLSLSFFLRKNNHIEWKSYSMQSVFFFN